MKSETPRMLRLMLKRLWRKSLGVCLSRIRQMTHRKRDCRSRRQARDHNERVSTAGEYILPARQPRRPPGFGVQAKLTICWLPSKINLPNCLWWRGRIEAVFQAPETWHCKRPNINLKTTIDVSLLGTVIEQNGDGCREDSLMPVGWPLHLDGAVKQRCLHRTTTLSELDELLQAYDMKEIYSN